MYCFIPAPTAMPARVISWYGKRQWRRHHCQLHGGASGVSADFEALYVIALIDLAEGPRMMSQIVDTDPTRWRWGSRSGWTLQRGQKNHTAGISFTPRTRWRGRLRQALPKRRR
ncbi:MAG: hypothetical protein CM15mP103_07140 [Gammaproteobacteria bacterium]|nr:MAG: hypothetical protein CM15mP103_07140 [Gammaproteobacteria bacterium]